MELINQEVKSRHFTGIRNLSLSFNLFKVCPNMAYWTETNCWRARNWIPFSPFKSRKKIRTSRKKIRTWRKRFVRRGKRFGRTEKDSIAEEKDPVSKKKIRALRKRFERRKKNRATEKRFEHRRKRFESRIKIYPLRTIFRVKKDSSQGGKDSSNK